MLDLSQIQTLALSWQATSSNLVGAKEAVSEGVLQYVEEQNQDDINKGEYNCVVGVSAIIKVITSQYPIPLSVIVSEISPMDANEQEISIWAISRCIDELVTTGRLLYIYDRQRVRSRIAEVVRYFSFLKQRFHEDYSRSPGLTHMVKLNIKTRKRPKREIPLDSGLRELVSCRNEVSIHPDIKPLLQERLNSSFRIFRQMVEFNFDTDDVKISQFQQDGLKELFKAAISSNFQSSERSYIIQSNTGSGKTEAFLFPILLYTLINYDQKGTKALLLYPRIDLCNDQLQRLLRYVWIINSTNALEGKKIKISLQHSGYESLAISCPYPGCSGTIRFNDDTLMCDTDNSHIFDFVTKKNQGIADIVITTPDSLHRRLMDRNGKDHIWDNKRILPKFVVFDEAHIYSEQMGMHVANIVRRLRHKITVKGKSEPIFIASSATVGEPAKFAQSLFSTASTTIIRPNPEEMEDLGREYIIFVKATDPRKVLVSEPEETDRFTIATNLSAMIQTAFCFYHTMFKGEEKDRIIGFIDSIDIIKRLGDKLCDAERTKNLYQLRIPDQKLRTNGNSACPHVACQHLPPNPFMNKCQVYEDGECWWTMDHRDLAPMTIHLHKSKTSLDCVGNSVNDDNWDMMITTSALEVGFDHPAVIGTFQYMSPMNIPGFVQRIGRGGRSSLDMPVAVVVLGSRPLDSFYFHHQTLLTNPGEDKLIIPIDPENRHIMAMHITSFIYDFISTFGMVQDVDSCYKDLNTIETVNFVTERINQFVQAANESFGLSEKEIHAHLNVILTYLRSCSEELEPTRQYSSFIANTRFTREGKTVEDIILYLSQAVARIEMEAPT